MTDTPPRFVIVGRVRKAHGLNGELVVEPITDAPDAIFAAGRRVFAGTASGVVAANRQELHIERAKPFKGGWIVRFAEIVDRTAADLWRERFFLLPESEIEPLGEGEVYLHELHGMQVRLVSGDPVGEVVDVFELPQGLMLEVSRPEAPSVMVPYDRVVTSVDRGTRVIEIDPPLGLID